MTIIPAVLIIALCLINIGALYLAMRKLVLNRKFRAAFGGTMEVIEIMTTSVILVGGLALTIHVVIGSYF